MLCPVETRPMEVQKGVLGFIRQHRGPRAFDPALPKRARVREAPTGQGGHCLPRPGQWHSVLLAPAAVASHL